MILTHSGFNHRRRPNSWLFYKELLALCLTTVLAGWVLCIGKDVSFLSGVTVIMSTGGGAARLYSVHWVHVVVASCDTHGVRWDYSVSRPPLGRARITSYYFKRRAFVVFQCILAANYVAVPFMSSVLRGIYISLVSKQLLVASTIGPTLLALHVNGHFSRISTDISVL